MATCGDNANSRGIGADHDTEGANRMIVVAIMLAMGYAKPDYAFSPVC